MQGYCWRRCRIDGSVKNVQLSNINGKTEITALSVVVELCIRAKGVVFLDPEATTGEEFILYFWSDFLYIAA